ncbi:MAG TPA: Ger(x)C family spore germination protein [Bacillota bacterium]|nr:Ger(x)C family spore germination protein [Bacillota bacterium]
MKTKLRFGVLLLQFSLLFGLLLNFSGCWNRREVEDLAIVVGIGVDRTEVPDNILFTAQIVKPGEAGKSSGETAGGRSGETKAFWNVSSTKSTIFDAARDVTHQTGRRLFVAHNQVIIFGHDLATAGVQGYLDFFMRAHEMRPNNLVLVANGTAAEVMDVKPEIEKLPAMNMTKVVQAYGLTSHMLKISLQDFAARLMSKTQSPVAPLVQLEGDQEKRSVMVSGLAIFKKDKMVGSLNQSEARGLLWATGKVQSGVITVPTPDGSGKVALEILRSHTQTTPEIRGGTLRIRIAIQEEASLSEQSTTVNLISMTGLRNLEKEQAEAIRREIRQAFDKSVELKSDFFGFGELFHQKYPARWTQFEAGWDAAYPKIQLELRVKTMIRKTDLISRPVAPEEGT